MKRYLILAFLGVLLAAVPDSAFAQRRGRSNSPGMTPYGPEFSPAEWKQAGGNPMIYEQIMEQKMMAAQQKAMQQEYQAMVKQQQAYQKWIKDQAAKKAKGQATDPMYDQMLAQEAAVQKARDEAIARAAAKKAKKKSTSKSAASK